MRHFATPEYWFHYRLLPETIRDLADKNFALLKENPRHPSLRLKKVGPYWSARVGIGYRALGKDHPAGILCWRIGSHADYDALVQ